MDKAGPTAGFALALAGGAGALAMLTTMLRSRTLAPRWTPAITLIDSTGTDEQLAQQAAA